MTRLLIAGGRVYRPTPRDVARLDALARELPPIAEVISGRAGRIWGPHADEDAAGRDIGKWLYPPQFGQAGSSGEDLNEMWLNLLTRTALTHIYGADVFGEWWAVQRGLAVKPFPANWSQHGKHAGPLRNREMALHAAAGPCSGVVVLLPGGRGTESMASEARRAGLRIYDWRRA